MPVIVLGAGNKFCTLLLYINQHIRNKQENLLCEQILRPKKHNDQNETLALNPIFIFKRL